MRGGLESTANAPISAASMQPTPTAAKSRLTFSCPSGSLGNERTTAAVCIMHTSATISDTGSNCVNSYQLGRSESRMQPLDRQRPHHRRTPLLKRERPDREAAGDESNERPRNSSADPVGDQGDGKDPDADTCR